MVFSRLQATPTVNPKRLHYRVHLDPHRPGVFVSVHPKRGEPELSTDELRQMLGELHELDQTIIREMRATSVFGQVGDTVFARILPLLARRRTVLNGEPLRFADEPLHPRLSVEMVPFKGMRVRLQLETEEGVRFSVAQGKLMAGSVAYFLTPQALFEIDSRAPWELGSWAKTDFRDLPSEASVAVRDEFVSGLKNLGVPPEDLLQLAVRRAPPDEIELTLSAIIETSVGPRVNGTLRIRYGAIWAEIENRRPASPYLDGDQSAGVVERDLVMEESARATLKAASFKYEKSQDRFVCLGDPALQLFDKERSPLPAHWTLIHQSEAPVLRRNLRLDAQIELRADEGLVDVSVGIAAEEDEVVRELVEIKDLLKWLHSGQQYLLLSDGSYIAPSKEMRERLAVVEDLGLESGRALLSPMCVGLLRKLGDHEALRISDEATRAWLDEVTGRETPAPVPIPKGLQIPLRDYQQHGLDWLYMLHRHRLTGILADDMGLGKTAQALVLLALAKEREGPQPSLIIAPTSVIGVWRDEAARFLPDLKVGLWQGTPEERRSMKVEDYDLVVTSYGVLRRDADIFTEHSFRYVILDEAQNAKNTRTQNARAIRKLKSARRLALTGTPIENRVEELWATFDFLAPGFLGSLRQFRKRYGRPISQGDDEALLLLKNRIAPFILRRLKGEVAKELPPKIETTIRCEMLPGQRALYDHLAGRLKKSIQTKVREVGIERSQIDILAALTRLRQISCDPALLPAPPSTKVPPSAKLELFEELMHEALDSGNKIVVFSQFVKMQKRLIEVIRKLGVEPEWLHGGTRKRDEVIARFQDENGPPVIVVSLKAGGTGVTLTRADTVIHFDPWWNPAVEQQASDRTHRLGQTKTVTVYKLVCANSIEERVVEMAARKEQLTKDLLGSDTGSGAKRISAQEVLALLD